ncbi:hypothetical protein ACIRYZ_32625 [Kitasatospora sp. NPDC101155]|uniref:hypothetical protein n=1 Tax=Kitasatospora sp. NPDC101155 TaxID=3364097 RepID=UPI0037F927F6
MLSAALDGNQAINQRAFESAVATIDDDLDATAAGLGAAALVAALALAGLGVRPRLREFVRAAAPGEDPPQRPVAPDGSRAGSGRCGRPFAGPKGYRKGGRGFTISPQERIGGD